MHHYYYSFFILIIFGSVLIAQTSSFWNHPISPLRRPNSKHHHVTSTKQRRPRYWWSISLSNKQFTRKQQTDRIIIYRKAKGDNTDNNCDNHNNNDMQPDILQKYDLVIVGAGASGLFASGAATMLGSKTLLLDKKMTVHYDTPSTPTDKETPTTTTTISTNNIGGDCTNTACVPSKAVRSIAQMAEATTTTNNRMMKNNNKNGNDINFLALARRHATQTVETVRSREDPSTMVERNPNLDVMIVDDCYFTSPYEMKLHSPTMFHSNNTNNNNNNKNNVKNDKNPNATVVTVQSKKFLIATGASPIQPHELVQQAKQAGLPLYTYRTLFRVPLEGQEKDITSIWNLLDSSSSSTMTNNKTSTHSSSSMVSRPPPPRVVIVGGGATACEVGQSLARLGGGSGDGGGRRLEVVIVAPTLLSGEEVTLQRAAAQILTRSGVTLVLGTKLEHILENGQLQLSDGRLLPSVDAMVLCLGRSPSTILKSLQLKTANIDWNTTLGILVRPDNLQSTSAKHVYACGDCCSAVNTIPTSRTATHAAWTGYHAASHTSLPWLFKLGLRSSIHPSVPRVIYTDPELAMVGLSRQECIAKYGNDGFISFNVPSQGTDRDDMDDHHRLLLVEHSNDDDEDTSAAFSAGFIELRATRITGRILGFTGCGPVASEWANEMTLAIVNQLTVGDIARSLHSYPSHGYLMHRVALALEFSSVWGLLGACGTIGRLGARVGRRGSQLVSAVSNTLKRRRRTTKQRHKWEAEGASSSILVLETSSSSPSSSAIKVIPTPLTIFPEQTFQWLSYLEVEANATLCEQVRKGLSNNVNSTFNSSVSNHYYCLPGNGMESFESWQARKPARPAKLQSSK